MKPPLVGMLPPLKICPCVVQINLCPVGMVFLNFYYSKLFSGKVLYKEINCATEAKKNASCMAQSNQHGHFSTLPILSSLPPLKMNEEAV